MDVDDFAGEVLEGSKEHHGGILECLTDADHQRQTAGRHMDVNAAAAEGSGGDEEHVFGTGRKENLARQWKNA